LIVNTLGLTAAGVLEPLGGMPAEIGIHAYPAPPWSGQPTWFSAIWGLGLMVSYLGAFATLVITYRRGDEVVRRRMVFAAMRAGARGYVLKGSAGDNLVRAIAAVAEGEAIFGPGIARRILAYLSRPRTDETLFPELTPREREVLALIAGGLGNATIAARLGLATATVGNHITNIFAKLQVATRAEAIVRARTSGLGT
jgi:DNA-binding CsgD family transcriptional regulator